MSQAPWYINSGKPSLNHQRKEKTEARGDLLGSDLWGFKGARAGPASKTFRKGACDNCGALTHRTKDCLERPRKKGAKYSGKDIQADEVLLNLGDRDYDAKRDRYNGYDPKEYREIYEQYERVEDARRKLREEQLDREASEAAAAAAAVAESSGPKETKTKDKTKDKKKRVEMPEDDEFGDFGSSDDEDEQVEEKYAETADMPGQKVSGRQTQRNLRIREDRSKYLMDLSEDAPYYDPKSRAMRENPNAPPVSADGIYVSENFQRASGEAQQIAKMQVFAWEAEQRGSDLSLQANPTQAALAHKENMSTRESKKASTTQSILEKYGGAEHLVVPPKELMMSQSTNYVEYDRSGRLIKGRERAMARSRFDEDVYPNNHQSVWGSWYAKKEGKWGYQCCHSTTKNSYCAGDAGKEATEASSRVILDKLEKPQRVGRESSADRTKTHSPSKLKDDKMTEEELETYRLKRTHFDDPISAFKDGTIV